MIPFSDVAPQMVTALLESSTARPPARSTMSSALWSLFLVPSEGPEFSPSHAVLLLVLVNQESQTSENPFRRVLGLLHNKGALVCSLRVGDIGGGYVAV